MQGEGRISPNMLTTREAAGRAGLSLQGLRDWARRYPGLALKVGGRWRVNAAILSSILHGQPPHSGEHGHGQRRGGGKAA